MGTDATGIPAAREDALRVTLARLRAAYQRTIETIEADLAEAQITHAQAQDATHAALAACVRDCDLAEVEAATGWQCWTGVGGILYARRPMASPPRVVRAPSAQALRAAIEDGRR